MYPLTKQGEQKGIGATPRFALYVVRTKPLLLALRPPNTHN